MNNDWQALSSQHATAQQPTGGEGYSFMLSWKVLVMCLCTGDDSVKLWIVACYCLLTLWCCNYTCMCDGTAGWFMSAEFSPHLFYCFPFGRLICEGYRHQKWLYQNSHVKKVSPASGDIYGRVASGCCLEFDTHTATGTSRSIQMHLVNPEICMALYGKGHGRRPFMVHSSVPRKCKNLDSNGHEGCLKQGSYDFFPILCWNT